MEKLSYANIPSVNIANPPAVCPRSEREFVNTSNLIPIAEQRTPKAIEIIRGFLIIFFIKTKTKGSHLPPYKVSKSATPKKASLPKHIERLNKIKSSFDKTCKTLSTKSIKNNKKIGRTEHRSIL